MANPIASFNMPTEYDLKRSKIDRAQRMAEMLMQQSQAPAEQFSYGGYTAPTSPITGVSKIIQGLMSQYQMGQADDRLEELGVDTRKEAGPLMDRMFALTNPAKPAVPGSVDATGLDYVDRDDPAGSQSVPISPEGKIPTLGGMGEGANVGSAAVPESAKTRPQRMADLMAAGQNPITSPYASAMFGQMIKQNEPYILPRGGQRRGPNDELLAENITPIGPQSVLGKLKDDLNKGLITQEQFDAAVLKANNIPDDRTLVQVYDPNGPTGTRWVPRVDAAGQPGKPGAGLRIVSDGQGGFTVEQGHLQPDKSGEALQKNAVSRLKKFTDGVDKMRDIAGNMELLSSAIESFDTGFAGNQLLAFQQFGKRLGIETDGLSHGELIRSTVAKIAPSLRIEGSGSTSNFDVEQFIKALPNLTTTKEGNRLIIAAFNTLKDRKQAELEFMQNYYNDNKSLNGVERAIDKEFGFVFPRPKTAEDRENLKLGTLYIAPNGSMVVRR